MSSEVIFYTNPMSRGRTVRWMLEEIGEPYETCILDYETTMKAPEYLAVNPMGKVPAIRHGDAVVTEAAAICAYLADAFPAAGLAPPAAERGAYYRWLFFAAGPIEALILNNALGLSLTEDQQRTAGFGNAQSVVSALESALDGREYLAGGRFSAADVYVGSALYWGMGFGGLPKQPLFEDYVGRLNDRPARQRAEQIDGPIPG